MPELYFKGKQFVRNHHLSVPHRPLKPDKGKSVGDGKRTDGNLIIHGDNLHALKSLLPFYAGKVNCVYIDPPYNTGNEGWCYNDNVDNLVMQEWLAANPVGIEDGLRHDKWCAMMWPRLVLLRELLAVDGAIFISIDDGEQHRLRMLMDEIFGENNFVANVIWQKRFSPTNDSKYFSSNHDFILCYAKKVNQSGERDGWQRLLLPRGDEQDKRYKYDDNDGRGPWASSDLSVKSYSSEYDYPVTNPNTGKEHLPPRGSCWRYNKKRMSQLLNDNRIVFGHDGKGVPRLKRYLSEVQQGIVPVTIWKHDEVGSTDDARKLMKSIFSDQEAPFENPKPPSLIQHILQIATGSNAVILDSFAGSGTTAHATLALNKADGGNRRFIMVECEDYADTITAERVRRVIKGVPDAKDEQLKQGLGGEFTYCELGERLEMDKLLNGKKLPSYEDLGALLFHTATNEVLDPSQVNPDEYYVGESTHYHVWLIYRSRMDFLKSNDSALTLEHAQKIVSTKPIDKRHLVFAPISFASAKMLLKKELPVDYQPLPWSLYRVAGS